MNYLYHMTRETGIVYYDGKMIQVENRVDTVQGRITDSDDILYVYAQRLYHLASVSS